MADKLSYDVERKRSPNLTVTSLVMLIIFKLAGD